MKQSIEDEGLLRSYLLGVLTPGEQMQVEERLFLESDYLRQLQEVEEELIDDYVAGELSASEQERIREFLLSKPERYSDVRIAFALQKYIKSNADDFPAVAAEADDRHAPVPTVAWWSFLQPQQSRKLWLVAALLLVMLGCLWVVVKVMRKPDVPGRAQQQLPPEKVEPEQPTQKQVEQKANTNSNLDGQRKQNLSAQKRNQPRPRVKSQKSSANNMAQRAPRPEPERPSNQPGNEYTAVLVPGGPARDGETAGNVLHLLPHTELVNLRLPLIGNTKYLTYVARVKTIDNTTLLTVNNLKPASTLSVNVNSVPMGKPKLETVVVQVPVKILRPQKYHLELVGITITGEAKEINTFFFQVEKN
jgi:hypothetical protein